MAEETVREDSGDIRRKAFVRLGIAAAVTALALSGLWWLDSGNKPAPKPQTTEPTPIVTATAPIPPEAPIPIEEAQPAPEPEILESQTSQEAAPMAPPPPSVHSASSFAEHTRTQAVTPTNRAHALAPQAAKLVAGTPTATSQPSANGRYAVQVGVFSSPAHAQELVDQLTRQGIHAYVETRVHVGPFTNRTEAEKAQAMLKKLGITGMIAPSAATK